MTGFSLEHLLAHPVIALRLIPAVLSICPFDTKNGLIFYGGRLLAREKKIHAFSRTICIDCIAQRFAVQSKDVEM